MIEKNFLINLLSTQKRPGNRYSPAFFFRGLMSLIGYLPDVFFAKLAGNWLDRYGLTGYNYIWYWGIGCALLGTIVCCAAFRYAKKSRKS